MQKRLQLRTSRWTQAWAKLLTGTTSLQITRKKWYLPALESLSSLQSAATSYCAKSSSSEPQKTRTYFLLNPHI